MKSEDDTGLPHEIHIDLSAQLDRQLERIKEMHSKQIGMLKRVEDIKSRMEYAPVLTHQPDKDFDSKRIRIGIKEISEVDESTNVRNSTSIDQPFSKDSETKIQQIECLAEINLDTLASSDSRPNNSLIAHMDSFQLNP